MLILWALLSTSCNNTPQNGNNNSLATNNSVVETNTNGPAKTPPPDPCAGSTIAQRQTDVNTYLANEIQSIPKLRDQKAANKFDYRVINPAGTMYLTVYVGGIMSVNHGSANGLLSQLNRMMDPVMKDGCVLRVDLVPMAQLPPATAAAPSSIDGFEWMACDYPSSPCPDGTCSESCNTVVTPTPKTSPTSTPSGGNTNRNGNKVG